MAQKAYILDSTLRDGAQGEGISFSIEDKVNIVLALDRLGVSYIEAGNPGSNPKDIAFFQRMSKIKLKNSVLAAFGSTAARTHVSKTTLHWHQFFPQALRLL
jgi:2-isopropylmalate synthase